MKGEEEPRLRRRTWAPEAPWLSGIHLLEFISSPVWGLPSSRVSRPSSSVPKERSCQAQGRRDGDRKVGHTQIRLGGQQRPRGQSRRADWWGPLHQDPSACLLP